MGIFNRDRKEARTLAITGFFAVSTSKPSECWYEISGCRYETGVTTQNNLIP